MSLMSYERKPWIWCISATNLYLESILKDDSSRMGVHFVDGYRIMWVGNKILEFPATLNKI